MVAMLIRLRAEGRTGEAHVVLCEAAGRPPEQLPLLAAELHRAGLGADWAELLWEAASLPPARLAAAAGALAVAGRDSDCGQLLRQGVSRPAEEIADAVLALGEAGRAPEARALLSAFVQARTPEDAALVAVLDPRRLVPQLIDAARAISGARERDVVHALRVAGVATARPVRRGWSDPGGSPRPSRRPAPRVPIPYDPAGRLPGQTRSARCRPLGCET